MGSGIRRPALALSALLFLLPGLALAGSVTSRWDLTVGGYVKFDMGYTKGGRQGYGSHDSAEDLSGNFEVYSGASRLNFLVKGTMPGAQRPRRLSKAISMASFPEATGEHSISGTHFFPSSGPSPGWLWGRPS